MSLRADGAYRCDRCDADIENASIENAVTISDLQTDAKGGIVHGAPRILHLCRANKCNTRVLTKSALAAFTADQERKKK